MNHLIKGDTDLNPKELLRLGKLIILTALALGAYALVFGAFIYLFNVDGVESFIGCLAVFSIGYLFYWIVKERRAGHSPSSTLKQKVESSTSFFKILFDLFRALFDLFIALLQLFFNLLRKPVLFLLKIIGIGLLIWFAIWLILAIGPLWLIVFLLVLIVLYLFTK